MDLPAEHAEVLARIQRCVAEDGRFDGLAAGGSLLTGGVDAYSDLDLVVVTADQHHRQVMDQRAEIAASWGKLLTAFTGEHVGEPRLLICLYADPLLHVDLKFLRADELAVRIEDPIVLWERDRVVSAALAASAATPLTIDGQWIEDRFWTWVHYAATKLARGELFEVLEFLAFLRGQVLAPLALEARGLPQRGVRRFEQLVPDLVPDLASTVAAHDAAECAAAVGRCVDTYRSLRAQVNTTIRRHSDAEDSTVRYLESVCEDPRVTGVTGG